MKIGLKKQPSKVVEPAEQIEKLPDQIEKLSDQIIALEAQLVESKNREQRSLADYQNLVRRTQEERVKIFKLAARDFIEGLIQPLAHLSLAADQLNETGLNMVVSQLWQVLEENGLKKIDSLGKDFDIKHMEVVDKGEKGRKVIKVVKEGYLLNDEVVQHTKVILD